MLIKDGGTLVLGGLIQDSVTNSEQSVPLLGSIPIIGELFRTRNTEKTKTNFLIFLQPHILRNDAQAADRDRREVRLHPRAAAHPQQGSARDAVAALPAGRSAAADGATDAPTERHPQPAISKTPIARPRRRRNSTATASGPTPRRRAPQPVTPSGADHRAG